MVDDEASAAGRGFEGPAHDPAVRDGAAVVREGDGAGRDEVGHVDELAAARAARDRGDGQDVGQAGPAGLGQDPLGDLPPVVDRAGVRQQLSTYDESEPVPTLSQFLQRNSQFMNEIVLAFGRTPFLITRTGGCSHSE